MVDSIAGTIGRTWDLLDRQRSAPVCGSAERCSELVVRTESIRPPVANVVRMPPFPGPAKAGHYVRDNRRLRIALA
jgi:hypothetical protein